MSIDTTYVGNESRLTRPADFERHAHWLLRIGLASVFLFHGVGKLVDVAGFAEKVCARVRNLSLPHPRSTTGRYVTVRGDIATVTPNPDDGVERLIVAAESALEAAEMDGANPVARFVFIVLPHLSRAITIVILIQTIFLLSIFAEIFVTTGGAFGTRTLTYLIYQRVLESQNVGLGSAGGVYAIILANIVAIFLMRIVGKNLDA